MDSHKRFVRMKLNFRSLPFAKWRFCRPAKSTFQWPHSTFHSIGFFFCSAVSRSTNTLLSPKPPPTTLPPLPSRWLDTISMRGSSERRISSMNSRPLEQSSPHQWLRRSGQVNSSSSSCSSQSKEECRPQHFQRCALSVVRPSTLRASPERKQSP